MTQQDAPVQLLRPLQPHPGLLLVLQLVDDRVVDGAILHPPEDVLVETCRNMFQRNKVLRSPLCQLPPHNPPMVAVKGGPGPAEFFSEKKSET